MGGIADNLHVQCVILGEILLGTLDRIHDELVANGDLGQYQNTSLDTGRRQVIEYFITQYYKQKTIRGKPSYSHHGDTHDSLEIKEEVSEDDFPKTRDYTSSDQQRSKKKTSPGAKNAKGKSTGDRRTTKKRGHSSVRTREEEDLLGDKSSESDEDEPAIKKWSERESVTSAKSNVINIEPDIAMEMHHGSYGRFDSDDDMTTGFDDDDSPDGAIMSNGDSEVEAEEESCDLQQEESCDTQQGNGSKRTQDTSSDQDIASMSRLPEVAENPRSGQKPKEKQKKLHEILVITKPEKPLYETVITEPANRKSYNESTMGEVSSSTHIESGTSADYSKPRGRPSHSSKPKKFRCNVCGKAFISRTGQRNHEATFHQQGKNLYSCPTCGKTFFSRVPYIEHVDMHNGVKRYVCNLCDQEFRHQCTLRTHRCKMATEQQKRLFRCNICSQTYSTPHNLEIHIRAVHNKDSFNCECGKKYSYFSGLHRHRKDCTVYKELKDKQQSGSAPLH